MSAADVPETSGRPSPVTLRDPRDGTPRSRTVPARDDEVREAVAEARHAQADWAALTPGERGDRLSRLADAVEATAAKYVDAERAGTGKPEEEALAEIRNATDLLRFYAGAGRTGLAPAGGRYLTGHESWVRWEPLGTVAAIVPWNYPLMMAVWRLGPALAAGNSVVLKPALTTPDTALLLAADAQKALGPGVVRAVTGDRETGRLLVRSAVDAVAFTGSVAGGVDVAARAGLRRVSLELGGNCPVVVLPDAPGDSCREIVRACVYNAGQSCAAPARVITLRENHRRVVEGLADAMDDQRAGADFGPLNNPDQLARYDRILSSSGAAFLHTAPVAPQAEPKGYWRPGTVLADLDDDDPAVREEVFGPCLTVQRADSVEHAVALANSTPMALAASVWGGDASRLLTVAGALDAGEVWVNCHLRQTAELPHGGRRGSGHGTDLSTLALNEYQRPKTVTVRLS
ncbi:aldehyde dehydrogenase family protein [Streptomyces sp. NPDC006314]|uniref:aldehyde dehydrogenase family protein n=1 Tax=Streptomyces sp. NPDC006314 TaxID=3154475 RepID=UPI0033B7F656